MPNPSFSLVSLCLFLSLCFTTKQTYAQTNCAPNMDFEAGDYSRWKFYTGACCPIATPVPTPPIINRHELTNGTGLDPYGNFPIVAPGGGAYSLKLGNDNVGGEAERAIYYLRVPGGVSQYIVVYRYAVVFQDPHHALSEQPRFEVKAYDSATNQQIPCNEFTYVAASSLPGFQQSALGADVFYKPWTSSTIDLSDYAGKTIALDFASGDCSQLGHFGYGYLDMDCSLFKTYSVACKIGSGGNGTVTLNGVPGYSQYKWMDATLTTVIGSGQDITIPTPAVTTKYAVIVTPYSGFGCDDTFYTKVEIFEPRVSADTAICGIGGAVQLNTYPNVDDAPYTYSWTPAAGLSCTTCPNPIASPQAGTDYVVTVTGNSGCIKTDTVNVQVADEVNAILKTFSDSACQYSPFVVQNIANNPQQAYHEWKSAGGLVQGQGTAIATIFWDKPGKKMIYLHVSNSVCNVYDSIGVYVKPSARAYFSGNNHVCLGDTIEVHPFKNTDAKTEYYWNIDDWNIAGIGFKEPLRLGWNTVGRKHVSLTVKSPNGCVPPAYDTVINVHEFPVADIAIGDRYVCMDDTLHLGTIEGKDYMYEWRPIGTFIQNNLAKVEAIVNREQYISVKTTNRWGCAISDSAYISPKHCCDIFIPEAFTPNGDGKNDLMRIRSTGFQNIMTFMIMNRWGQKVFETTDQGQGWDGYFHDKPQDAGMYTYYVKYKCSDKEEFEKTGNFILIR
ncbi:MAG: gliding motility-associated C-terminal domain-containing protein [Sphingobacteriales bacterium]|nr:MAG: gliding motility-associated C-terminal domain-containing protein [Sphingobacteriales bacterium]